MSKKTKASDLTEHLFEQIERLNDTELQGEKLEAEIQRGRAIGDLAARVIDNNKVQLDAWKTAAEYGFTDRLPPLLPASGQTSNGNARPGNTLRGRTASALPDNA